MLDRSENCPINSNPSQADNDEDGIGDACDPTITCQGGYRHKCWYSGSECSLHTSGKYVIYGLGGNNIICGGDGFDQLIGNTGNDKLDGGKDFYICTGGPAQTPP